MITTEMTATEIENRIAELQKELNMLNDLKQQKDKIYLLSVDEYERYKDKIPPINTWWWLRSPGRDTDWTAYVSNDGSVYGLGNCILTANGAIRPALKYSYIESKMSKSTKGNDYFIFNEVRWKIIDPENEIAISDLPIRFDMFDAFTNDYRNSYIRKYLLDWMEGAAE